MNEQEIKDLLNQISIKNGEAIKDAVAKYAEGLLTKAEFKDQFDQLVSKEELKAITDAVEKQGMKINELIGGRNDKTILDHLRPHAENIKRLESGKGKVRFALKATVARSNISGSTIAQYEPGVGQLPTLAPQLMSLFSAGTVGPNSNGVIRYVDQDSVTRAANAVAEAAAKPEGAVNWIERLMRIETIAEWLPVTQQALNDLEFMASELDQLLRLNLSLEIDQQLYDGSGTSPDLRGVYTAAPAYTPTAGLTTQANIFDLIAAVATDIANNKDNLYEPNVVLINPVDMLRTKLRKATDGHYVMPPFATQDGRVIDGLRVIPTARVAANTLLVGDFRFGRVYQDGDITVELGWINDQFVRNMVTMLAEVRLGLLIRDVNADAFRKVTNITTALTGIE